MVPTGTPPTRPVTDTELLMPAITSTESAAGAERRAIATDILDPQRAEIEELRNAYELAEDRLLAETEARVAAEVEAESLRARVEQVRAEAQEHNRELDGRCAELERRLTDALAELEAVTTAERRAVRETRQLKEKVARQAAELDQLKASQS